MAKITLHGNAVNTLGSLPGVGSRALDFKLVKNDLSEAKLSDYLGNKVVLNIFPSLDTGTCAASVREFNKKATELSGVKVLCISRDLPFAQARFCGAEGIKNVETLSDFRSRKFGVDYQLEIADGPLEGLLSRVVIVINENGEVVYTQQVGEIVDEPDYEKALAAL